MLRNGVVELAESLNCMALRAIRLLPVFNKLALVVVGVTICASVMSERICGFSFVTLFAS
jgi:hypothetical protein